MSRQSAGEGPAVSPRLRPATSVDVARLAGVDVPPLPEKLDSFADLHARLDATLAFVRAADRAAVDAGPARSLTVPWGKEDKTMTGLVYFQRLALPNFMFHATTAYDILRHNGVPLEKTDFTGTF